MAVRQTASCLSVAVGISILATHMTVGLCLVVFGSYGMWQASLLAQALEERGVDTTGIITACESFRTITIHYEYTVVNPNTGQERTYRKEADSIAASWDCENEEGREFTVRYLPEDPRQSRTFGIPRGGPHFEMMAAMGFVFFVISVFLSIGIIWRLLGNPTTLLRAMEAAKTVLKKD